jgi:hypothetical protein
VYNDARCDSEALTRFQKMVCDALYEQKMYDLTYVEQYKGDSRARNGGGVGVKYLVDSGSENIHAVFLGRDPSELNIKP